MTIQMKRHCLDCGAPVYGRSDKKFCNDQCRNHYNNQLSNTTNSSNRLIKNIHSTLKRNRRILEELSLNADTDAKKKVSRWQLTAKGFNFNYLTSTYQKKDGTTYYFCYEYGYLVLNDEELLLMKEEN